MLYAINVRGVCLVKEEKEILSKKGNWFFLFFYALALFMLFILFKPFFTYLLLGVIIVVFLFPMNLKIRKYIGNKVISSLIMTIFVLIVILLPTFFIINSFIQESTKVYNGFSKINITQISDEINQKYGIDPAVLNIEEESKTLLRAFAGYLTRSTLAIIESAITVFIGLFIMFFMIYYGFKEGEELKSGLMNLLPITKKHKEQLKSEANKVLRGVLYGQVLVSILQGILGGIGFWIFGIPNPVLWGVVMAILAFVPLLGTPIVWIPAVIFEFSNGNTGAAIGLLLYSGILVMNIDNFLKPKIIGKESGMHPLLALLGIFGGVAVFGMIGMLIGPIVVALSVLVIKFFNKDVHFT